MGSGSPSSRRGAGMLGLAVSALDTTRRSASSPASLDQHTATSNLQQASHMINCGGYTQTTARSGSKNWQNWAAEHLPKIKQRRQSHSPFSSLKISRTQSASTGCRPLASQHRNCKRRGVTSSNALLHSAHATLMQHALPGSVLVHLASVSLRSSKPATIQSLFCVSHDPRCT